MKKAFITCAASLFFYISCSNDDFTPIIEANNITLSVDENSNSNTVIGTIDATSNDGELSYTIVNQSVQNAVKINLQGDLLIDDSNVFDYEINNKINLTVNIKSKSKSKTIDIIINVLDVDRIAEVLTTTKDEYLNSENNNWIQITKEEYKNLASNILNVSKVATSDEIYDSTEYPNPYGTYESKTFTNIGFNVPPNSYVFAVKFFSEGSPENNIEGTKVKFSKTSITEDYSDLGSTLGQLKSNESYKNNGQVYFVLKNNTVSSINNEGYLGLFDSKGFCGDIDTQGNTLHYESQGEKNNYNGVNASSNSLMYQGLSTNKLQW